MKEQVKAGITKEAYEQIRHVDFSGVVVRLKALRCELDLNSKVEKDHCAILDIEIPQKERKMNIDKLATQTPEEKEALDSIKSVHLRDYQKADKSHTKVEYEKVTESIFDLREEFERGELHYDFGDEDWFTFNDEASLVAGFKEGNVYRRIEITESPQQREERERLEAAYDLCCLYGHNDFESAVDFNRYHPQLAEKWLRIVDKTNYRKGSN